MCIRDRYAGNLIDRDLIGAMTARDERGLLIDPEHVRAFEDCVTD